MIRPAIHKVISSERGICYLPVLTSRLRALEATTTGVISQTFEFPCGVRGRIFSSENFRKIEIWQEPPSFLNGLVHWGTIKKKVFDGTPPNSYPMAGPHNELYYPSMNPDNIDASLAEMEGDLKPGQQEAEYCQGFYADPLAEVRRWEGRQELAVEPAWIDFGANFGRRKPSQVSTISPGIFSGEMRKYVQVLLGAGKQIRYMSSVNVAHGIFTNQLDKSKWLIEIGRRGVLAMPLGVCPVAIDQHKRLNEQLGYMPTEEFFPDDFDAALADGRVRQLGDKGLLNGFYADYFCYGNIGFAFSYSGIEAQNTCHAYEWNGEYKYLKGYRHKVTLTVDDFGDPVDATIKIMDSGWLYHESPHVFPHPKFPGALGMYSMDFRAFKADNNGELQLAIVSPPVACVNSPLFVFYEGEDEHVVGYTYIEGETPVSNFHPEMINGNPEIPKYWADYDVEHVMYSAVHVSTRCGFSSAIGSPGLYRDSAVQTKQWDRCGSMGAFRQYLDPEHPIGLANTTRIYTTFKDVHVKQHDHNQSLVIPYGDREAYYHLIGDNLREQWHTRTTYGNTAVHEMWGGTSKVLPGLITEYTVNDLVAPVKDGPYGRGVSGTWLPNGPYTWTDPPAPTDPDYDPYYALGFGGWAIEVIPESETQTYKFGAFVAGKVRHVPFENRLRLVNWNQYWFDVFDGPGYYIYAHASAFTDKEAFCINKDFNYLMGKDCFTEGDYPYDHPDFNSSIVTYVGLP